MFVPPEQARQEHQDILMCIKRVRSVDLEPVDFVPSKPVLFSKVEACDIECRNTNKN